MKKTLIIHVLLLPLKFLVSLISLVTWYPFFKLNTDLFKFYEDYPNDQLSISEFKNQIEEIIADGDGCKYIGIAGHFIPDEPFIYENIYRFIYKGTLIRYPIEYMKEDSNNFSGDMFIGLLSIVQARYEKGLLTEKEKKKLKPVFDSILGTCKVSHPFKHEKDVNRGYILPWFTTMPGFAQIIVLAKLSYLIYGDKKYNRLYKTLMVLTWPIAFSYGFCLFLGKVEACNWYSEHTMAWAYFLGSKLGIKRFKRLLRKQAARHSYNPEILGLNALIHSPSSNDLSFIKRCLESYFDRQKKILQAKNTFREFDLKHFEWVTRSKFVLPPCYRKSSKYLWEKDPLKPKTGSRRWVADYVSLNNIYKELTGAKNGSRDTMG